MRGVPPARTRPIAPRVHKAATMAHEPTGTKPLWGVPGMQLPAYMQHVFNDLVESGHPHDSHTYRLAVGIVQNWAEGHDGHGHNVKPDTQAKAVAAVAEWEADRAKAHAYKKDIHHMLAEMAVHDPREFGTHPVTEFIRPHPYLERLHPRGDDGRWIVAHTVLNHIKRGQEAKVFGVSTRKTEVGKYLVRKPGGGAKLFDTPEVAAHAIVGHPLTEKPSAYAEATDTHLDDVFGSMPTDEIRHRIDIMGRSNVHMWGPQLRHAYSELGRRVPPGGNRPIAKAVAHGWDEKLHPRGYHGRWIAALNKLRRELERDGTASKEARRDIARAAESIRTGDLAAAHKHVESAVHSAGAGSARMKIREVGEKLPVNVGADVNRAAELLAQGRAVELDQPDEVSTLLDKLATKVQEAKDRGKDAPNFNLCQVSVRGTNLFCADTKGIPRIKMPQLAAKPTPGSRADKELEKNSAGYVDVTPMFLKELEKMGVAVHDEDVPASHLRASQNELNGGKVGSMAKVIESGKELMGDPRIFVSKDNYIVDGHHRWAANVGVSYSPKHKEVQQPVRRIDMGIIALLDFANKYAAGWGLPQASVREGNAAPVGKSALERLLKRAGAAVPLGKAPHSGWSEDLHPRGWHGRWVPKLLHSDLEFDVPKLLHDHPRRPGEPLFAWQGRVCRGLPEAVKHELLFRIRERYKPVDYIADGARRWRLEHGLPEPKVNIAEQKASLTKGHAVARAFETAPHEHKRADVERDFHDFVQENREMYAFMTRPVSEGGLGIRVEIGSYPRGEPYQSATEQAEDLRANRRIRVQSGLGGEHHLLTRHQYDMFRAVHDVFGHAGVGGGFDRHGEYEAWLMHMTMYTGPAALAMASEYHGVNSSLWAGKLGGRTGRAVVLPSDLIKNPWDANGNLVRKSA